MRIVEKHRLRSLSGQQWGYHRDQPRRGGDVDCHALGQILGIYMIRRSQGACVNCTMDPQIQPAPPIKDRTAQMRHRIRLGDIHRGQRGRTSGRLDPVIHLFQRTRGARNGHHMMRLRQRLGHGRAQPA